MKRFIIILLFALIPVTTYTQARVLPDPKPYFTAIIVSDIDASIQWYSDTLGFKVLNQTRDEVRGFKQANLTRGDVHIELIALKTAITPEAVLSERPDKKQIGGYFKIGFRVSDFDRWMAFLTQAGVKFHGDVVRDPSSGKKMIIIKDPDGNRIQLFEA